VFLGLQEKGELIRKVIVENVEITDSSPRSIGSGLSGKKSDEKRQQRETAESREGPSSGEGGPLLRLLEPPQPRRNPVDVLLNAPTFGTAPQIPYQHIMNTAETAASSQYLPEELIIEGHVISVNEHTRTPIFQGPLSLHFENRRSKKSLEVKTDGFLEASLSFDYGKRLENKERNLEAHIQPVEVKQDDIAHFFPRLKDYITSGTFLIEADLHIPNDKNVEISGTITAEGLEIAHPLISPEPLSGIDFSYRFSCSYDAKAPLPPPKVLGKNTPSNPSMVAAKQEFADTKSEILHGEIRFSEGELDFEGLELDFLPAFLGLYARSKKIPFGESPRIELSIYLPQTEVDKAIEALPAELVGPFEDIELDGSVAWDFYLELPLDRISDMNWLSETKLENFRVKKIPASLNIFRLDEEFCYTPGGRTDMKLTTLRIPEAGPVSTAWMRTHSELPKEVIRSLRNKKENVPEPPISIESKYSKSSFGPCSKKRCDPNYRYVFLEEMAPHLPLAVLTAEDGDFFYHEGINWHTMRYAIERNLRTGRIETGGSTITMQLIKNLFLTKKQTLRRKLHEAALVFLIEQYARISKTRILEIYLNIADFGPGILGVDEACRYYFDTSPSKVDPLESVWLASILSSPKKYHRYFEEGEVGKALWSRMRSYLELMHERKRLSDEDYRGAMQRQRLFMTGSRGGQR
jgi:hypothetical protein